MTVLGNVPEYGKSHQPYQSFLGVLHGVILAPASWCSLEGFPGAAQGSAWAREASDTQLAYSHPFLEGEKV